MSDNIRYLLIYREKQKFNCFRSYLPPGNNCLSPKEEFKKLLQEYGFVPVYIQESGSGNVVRDIWVFNKYNNAKELDRLIQHAYSRYYTELVRLNEEKASCMDNVKKWVGKYFIFILLIILQFIFGYMLCCCSSNSSKESIDPKTEVDSSAIDRCCIVKCLIWIKGKDK